MFRIASVRGLSGTFGVGDCFSSGGGEGVVISSRSWSFAEEVLVDGWGDFDFLVVVVGARGFVTLLEVELGPKARVDWARVEGLLRRVGGMVVIVVMGILEGEEMGRLVDVISCGLVSGGVLCGCAGVGVNM